MIRFIFWMLLASALGFVKLLVLAYFMPKQEFGQYIAYFGIATFAGVLVSFGLVEKTTKDYPRRWVIGQRRLIFNDAVNIGRILTLRFLVIGVAGVCLSLLDLVPLSTSAVLEVAVLGLVTGWLTLVASLYRAIGSRKMLQNFTFFRSAVTMCLVLTAGSLLGWIGAIGGDIVGSLIAFAFALRQLPRLYGNDANFITAPSNNYSTDNGHYQIYFANLAVAPQSMLDRAWIGSAIGSASAGSYGVIMIIPQVVQLLANVVVQYIGPLVIKLVHLKQIGASRHSAIVFNAVLLALFSLTVTILTLLARRAPYLNHIFSKFEISDVSLLIAGVIACGQIYGLIEFHLIARDRENDVLFASLVSCFIFILSFSVAMVFKARVEWFLVGAGLARWGQVWLLGRAYLRYA